MIEAKVRGLIVMMTLDEEYALLSWMADRVLAGADAAKDATARGGDEDDNENLI